MNKKIMVCVDMSDESLDLLKEKLKSWDWAGYDEIHFVHSFSLQVYTDAFYFITYPLEDQYEGVEKSVLEVLKDLEKAIISKEEKLHIKYMVKLSTSPKETIADYAKEHCIDEMVIGTRGVHGMAGIFSSSFAEYMVRNAPCELRILRTKSV
jgi:nucleotide-binding universal stress UspA family protein